MKIVRFSHNGQSPRLGILEGKDRVVDLEASYAALLASRGVVRAPAIAAALFPQSTRGFLEGGQASQDALASMMEAVKGGRFQAVAHPAGSVRLHAPINDPGKFICIGLNYKDHAEESGNPVPKEPPVFPKWNNAILDPGEPILRPRGEKTLDWEVELGVATPAPTTRAPVTSSSTRASGAPASSATRWPRWGRTSRIGRRSRIPTSSS